MHFHQALNTTLGVEMIKDEVFAEIPQFTLTEFEDRVANVRKLLLSENLKVGVAYSSPHLPGDVQYLTGYDTHIECALVIITQDRVVPMGGAEGEAMFEDSGFLGEWRNLNSFEIPYQDYRDMRFWSLQESLLDLVGKDFGKIGVLTSLNTVPVDVYQHLQEIGEVVDVSNILRSLRYKKSVTELSFYRRSSAIATLAVREMLNSLESGMTELELAAIGDKRMKELGAYSNGFETMVCSGPRINTIIGRASERRINAGEMVLIGASPRFRGYASTVGRTVVAGSPTVEQVEFLNHGVTALGLAAKQLFVGNAARNIDLAARDYLRSVGLEEFQVYGVGHGIGLSECLEEKTATALSDYEIGTGFAMMLDVGLFNHKKFHGARHEDPYLVGDDGHVERLTDLNVGVY
jgi:Xaa-Pro aminopeptidase